MLTNHKIRADINKATWEETEVPAVCETCLGSNPYVRMTREKFGAECKLCTRPFTVFKWQPSRGGKSAGGAGGNDVGAAGNKKPRKTNICLTCARQKNCCQACLLDLTFGLPLAIRDAALKMVATNESTGSGGVNTTSNASNAIIRQYIAQNYEHQNSEDPDSMEDEERRRMLEESDAARELLKKLSEGYSKRHTAFSDMSPAQRLQQRQKQQQNQESDKAVDQEVGKLASKLPLNGSNVPPKDTSITSLYVMGVDTDLPDYILKDYFTKFGPVASLVCIHAARSAFINFASRASAEAAAASVQTPSGKFVLEGSKLRLAWSKPRPLGTSFRVQSKLGRIVKMAMRKRDMKESGRGGSNTNDKHRKSGSRRNELAPLPGEQIEYKAAQAGYEG